MKQKVYLETNGCISRSLDLKRLSDYFDENSCERTSSPAKADKIVFLGCAAVKQEEEWSLKRVNDLQRYKGQLIVGGCIKEMAGKKFPENMGSQSINTRNLEDIDLFFPEFQRKFEDIPDANEGLERNLKHYLKNNVLSIGKFKFSYIRKLVQYYHTRLCKNFIIRVGRGCEEKCTFCSIWRAIGSTRSKSIEGCLKELKIATERGIKRINLVSDHLGAYGIDIGKTFPELLRAMISQFPEAVFVLEEFHPKWFMKYQGDLYDLIKKNKIFSLHIPLQSGSDRILKRMNRKYTMSEIFSLLVNIKMVNPKVKLYTDLIVGFPGETEKDFDDSMRAVKEVGFDSLSYYEYDSKYESPGFQRLPQNIVEDRVNRLTKFLWKNKIGGAPF